ncbi:MAG: hypothetical protein J5825_11815, partial [Lachnospiraceae bacterium]|nr:hypothetical protein [Lachnospiraceae bacterium]
MKKSKQRFRLRQAIRALRPLDYLILFLISAVLIAVTVLNTTQMDQILTSQSQEAGEVRLNNIRYELQETMTTAESSLNSFGFNMEELNREKADEETIREYVLKQKQDYARESVGVIFNTYVASRDFVYIPDFDMPEDYHATERLWYVGALERAGGIFISEPYTDRMTGKICYTMAKLLSDQNTVVALDFTLEDVQNSINKMLDGQEGYSALIITEDRWIVGYNDMDLVGQKVGKALPQYSEVVTRVIASKEHESFSGRVGTDDVTVFSSETKNGWYLIVCVNDTVLYDDIFESLLTRGMIFMVMLLFIVMLYLVSVVNRARAEEALKDRDRFLKSLSEDMDSPVKHLLSVSNVLHSAGSGSEDPEMKEAVSEIRESSLRLSALIENIRSFRMIEAERSDGKGLSEKKSDRKENSEDALRKGSGKKNRKGDNISFWIRGFRGLILLVLVVTLIMNLWVTISEGNSEAKAYLMYLDMRYVQNLNSWVQQQTHTSEMFANAISVQPELADDYEACVEWLNDVASHYPEISACYLANPYREHTVIMNTGWEPEEGWNVEDRPWYRETVKSEDGFSISSPYLDDQTGQYCITFSRMVYGEEGEFIGVFGIDFLLDKLLLIMNENYDDYSYAFLADKNGDILNHPNKEYEMSVDHKVNLADTVYADLSGNILTLKDYNGERVVAVKGNSEKTGFKLVVVANWTYIYGTCIFSAISTSVILLICMILVILMVNRIIHWQAGANKQLKEAVDYAEKAGKAKSDFLAQMSHEIRTPINAVIGMDEMILRESEDPQILEYAGNIQSAGRTLLELVNGILDLSKIEEGKMTIVPVRYDTGRLITDLVNMISERAERKNLLFETEISPELPISLYGDDVRLRQIITNLLTNAVKYTPEGSVRLIVRGEFGEGEDYKLYVAVADTGIGIREEDRDKLFRSFERLDEEKNRNIEGTGLGLSIVQGLLQKMGSELEVESEYGKGSTFFFTL